MTLRQTHTAAISAAKSGFSAASGVSLEKDPRLPSGKTAPRDRRRPDPLRRSGTAEVVPLLKAAPGLRPVAIFEEIGRRHPELGDGCAGPWSAGSAPGGAVRARAGGDVPPDPEPGRMGLSDFTDMGDLMITVAGQAL